MRAGAKGAIVKKIMTLAVVLLISVLATLTGCSRYVVDVRHADPLVLDYHNSGKNSGSSLN